MRAKQRLAGNQEARERHIRRKVEIERPRAVKQAEIASVDLLIAFVLRQHATSVLMQVDKKPVIRVAPAPVGCDGRGAVPIYAINDDLAGGRGSNRTAELDALSTLGSNSQKSVTDGVVPERASFRADRSVDHMRMAAVPKRPVAAATLTSANTRDNPVKA